MECPAQQVSSLSDGAAVFQGLVHETEGREVTDRLPWRLQRCRRCAGLLRLSVKVMLSIDWPIYVLTLTCEPELWVVTERLKSSGNEPPRVTSSDIQEGLAVPSLRLHIERSGLRRCGCLTRMK